MKVDSNTNTNGSAGPFMSSLNRNVTNFNMQHNKISRVHSPIGYATAENNPTRAVSQMIGAPESQQVAPYS